MDKILNDLGVAGPPEASRLQQSGPSHQNHNGPCSFTPTRRMPRQNRGPVLVSGLTGEGVEELLRRMDAALPVDPVVTLSLRLPLAEGRTLALVHALGHVLHSEVEDSHMLLDAEVPVSIARRLQAQALSPRMEL